MTAKELIKLLVDLDPDTKIQVMADCQQREATGVVGKTWCPMGLHRL